MYTQSQIDSIKKQFDVSERELRVSEKALTYKGYINGEPVFLKILTSDDEKWVSRFMAEVKTQQYLLENGGTVAKEITPTLLNANVTDPPYYIVMEWKRGASNYSPMRWAEGEVDIKVAQQMGSYLCSLHKLLANSHNIGLKEVTSEQLNTKIGGYLAEISTEYLEDNIVEGIRSKLPSWLEQFGSSKKQVVHGDPLFTNYMDSDVGLYLVDWEYAIYSHPAHDLACLWVTSSLAPISRCKVIDSYFDACQEMDAGFEEILKLLKIRYGLREISLLTKSRGYHITMNTNQKDMVIQDQVKTIRDALS